MKKNKIVVLAGMALLTVGTILNVHDALNEFGVMEISLHPQVIAQSGSTYQPMSPKPGATITCRR